MARLHKIKAYLYDNALTKDPNDFVARVKSEPSLTIKEVCELAVKHGATDVPVATMEHIVNVWLEEMGYCLCDSYSINANWFTASVHIKGVFNSPTEHFNPEKHSVIFEFHQGPRLRKELENISVEMLGLAATDIFIGQVVDVKTGSVNDLLTSGRSLRISGSKLKITGEDMDNGIYFIERKSQKRYKVDPSDIVVNNPSELTIVIPDDLIAGSYTLEIQTQFSGTNLLKKPRTAVFDKILTKI